MTIAMISEHGDPLAPLGGQQSGGQNVYIYELAKSLSQLGIKVDVFTRWENRNAAQVVRFARRAKVIRLKAGARHFISKDKFGPLMPEFIESFLKYTRASRVKYDLIHAHYYYSGWAGLQLRNILKIPLVETYHSLGIPKNRALGKRDTSPTERTKIEKQVMREADLIISTSPQEKLNMIHDYGALPSHIDVIPPGVNLRRFRPLDTAKARKELDINMDKKIVVFAGKMERRKGGLTLIAAIAVIKNIYPELYKNLKVLMFSGDPRIGRKKEKQEADIRHIIKKTIQDNGVEDAIALMPGITQEKLHKYYAAANVATMPSYYEPFGMVAIEAMASGTPVVASNVGGLKWTVQDGINGYLARPKDANDFARKIVKILSDSELEERLSKNAIEIAQREYGWPGVAQKIIKEYQRLIKTADKEG